MSNNKTIVLSFFLLSIVFGLGLGLFLVKNPRRCTDVAFQASSLRDNAPRATFDIEATLVKNSGFIPQFSYVISSLSKPLVQITVSSFSCEKISEVSLQK